MFSEVQLRVDPENIHLWTLNGTQQVT